MPAYADSQNTSQKLDSVQTEIETINQDVSKNKVSRDSLFKQLKQQSKAVSKSNKTLLELKINLAEKQQKLTQLQSQVESKNSDHKQQLEALNHQIRTAFINGQPSYLQVVLNQHDPASLSRSSQYFHYFNTARKKQLSDISEVLSSLSFDQKTLFTAQKQQQQLYKQQQHVRQQLLSQTKNRKKTLAALDAKIDNQASRLSTLRQQEQSLQTLLSSLKKAPVTPLANPVKNNTAFAKRMGRLSWPITGKVLAPYGSSRNVGKLTWQGILISAPTGSSVQAAAPGTVIFSDWLRGFGLLVIIDHGDKYMTLYGYNDTLLKQVGDTVTGGELIAQSGDKGIAQYAGLYFEIRHKGSPTNPLKWLDKHS